MKEQNDTMTRAAMNYGLYLGVGLVLNSLIFYMIGKPFSPLTGYFSYALIIGILSWSIWTFREHRGEEGISYSASLGFGTLVSLFASLIFAFFTYVMYEIVDKELLGKFFVFLEENMLKEGKTDEQMEVVLNMFKKFLTPLSFSISQVFNLTFLGFFFSLILSIFYKRRPANPFQGIE